MTLSEEQIEEISGKIEWEGGIEGAFICYGLDIPEVPKLQEKIEQLRAAYKALEEALEEAGIDFE